MEELHIPGKEEPETPTAEQPEQPKEAAPEVPTDTPKEPAKEPEEKPEEPEQNIKKRSIYDDYKDKKREAKEAADRAAELEQENEQLRTKNAEFEALLSQRDEARTPGEKADADDEIAEFAKRTGLDPDALNEMATIFGKRFQPSKELQEELKEIREWKEGQRRKDEDAAILATAPAIKDQLGIHDDSELSTVMKEVVKLSHTEEFHDKEVEYIVWKNQKQLSKLISPKKPSFESGDAHTGAAPKEDVDYSKGVTPEQMSNEMYNVPTGKYEIRSSR